MTETSADSPSDERDFQTLHKNTTRAELFPAKQHKEEWWEEAEHEGSSLSRYLYDLIQEARMYRDSSAPFIQTQDQTVKQLQNKIDELDDLISESNDDFEVYSETIQEFSGHLFDFSRFDDRRGSYVKYAEKRRKWAVEKLQLAFWLLIVVWGGLAIISILGYPRSSGQFLIAATSIVITGIIWFRHRDADYYPKTTEMRIIGTVLSPAISLAILILIVTGIRLFIEPLTVGEITSSQILQEFLP